MNLRPRTLGLLALAPALAAAAWLALPDEPDEERLRQVVRSIAALATRRDVSGIVEHVTEDFRSPKGTMASRTELKRLLLGVLMRADWARVYVLDERFDVKGDAATGTVLFIGARGEDLPDDPRQLPPASLQVYRVTASFVRDGDTFLVREADYQALAPGPLPAGR